MRGPIMGVYPCNKALALVMFLNNDVEERGGGIKSTFVPNRTFANHTTTSSSCVIEWLGCLVEGIGEEGILVPCCHVYS